MGSLATLILLPVLQDAARYEDPSKEIQWARSYEDAYAQARLRNVPILIFFTSDT